MSVVKLSLISARPVVRSRLSIPAIATKRAQVAQRFISIFEESKADAIVSPSGSCTAMVHHYPQLFAGDSEWLPRAQADRREDARAELVSGSRAQD